MYKAFAIDPEHGPSENLNDDSVGIDGVKRRVASIDEAHELIYAAIDEEERPDDAPSAGSRIGRTTAFEARMNCSF